MTGINLKSNEKSMFVGVNDMGKSVLFRHLIKQYLDSGVKVLLYDSEKEYGIKYKAFEHPNFKVIQPPKVPDDVKNIDQHLIDLFDKTCRQVWERGKMVIAIESIDFYSDPKRDLPPFLWRLENWGRNRGIGVLQTSRRIASVHKDCCGLNRHWFLFHCYLPNDIKYIRSFIGKTANQLPSLEPHHFIHWSGGKAELCNPIPYEGAN